MSDASILPANQTPLERALEASVELGRPDLTPVDALMRPEACPEHLLPWLAWALSVDDWDANWPEDTKRSAVAASIGIHRIKGTVKAVRDAIAAFGFGEAVITEGQGAETYNGARLYDGAISYGFDDHWAEYRVFLERPITQAQADQLRRILKNVAPARCHLKSLQFTAVVNSYNGAITYDGTFTYGAVNG